MIKRHKHKNICRDFNYIKHFLILVSAVSSCVSISAFASLIGVLIRTTSRIKSSPVGLKLVQSLLKLKSISKLSRKRGKSMNN